ncbi:MAG: F-box protein [Rhabdochlamydiaceae bacterium]|jgi:hypothetical protein
MALVTNNGINSQMTYHEFDESCPDEVFLKIFYKVVIVSGDAKALGACAKVCTRWKRVSEDDRIWKICTMSSSFPIWGQLKWKIFARCNVKDASHYKDTERNPIPWKQVYKDHYLTAEKKKSEPFSDFSAKKERPGVMLEFDILVPKTINGQPTTINKILEVYSKAPRRVCPMISEAFLKVYGNIPVEESYFARITFMLDADTCKKWPAERIAVIQEKGKGLYRLPKAIEHLVFMLLAPELYNGYKKTLCTQYVETLTDAFGRAVPVIGGAFQKISGPNGSYCFAISEDERFTLDDSSGNEELLNEAVGAGAVREF